jgi:hypothetical protein
MPSNFQLCIPLGYIHKRGEFSNIVNKSLWKKHALTEPYAHLQFSYKYPVIWESPQFKTAEELGKSCTTDDIFSQNLQKSQTLPHAHLIIYTNTIMHIKLESPYSKTGVVNRTNHIPSIQHRLRQKLFKKCRYLLGIIMQHNLMGFHRNFHLNVWLWKRKIEEQKKTKKKNQKTRQTDSSTSLYKNTFNQDYWYRISFKNILVDQSF